MTDECRDALMGNLDVRHFSQSRISLAIFFNDENKPHSIIFYKQRFHALTLLPDRGMSGAYSSGAEVPL